MHQMIYLFILLLTTPALNALCQRCVLTKEGYPTITVLGYISDRVLSKEYQNGLSAAVHATPDNKSIIIDSNITSDRTIPGAAGSFMAEAEVFDARMAKMITARIIWRTAMHAQKDYQSAHPLALLAHVDSGVPVATEQVEYFNRVCPSSAGLTPQSFIDEIRRIQGGIMRFSEETLIGNQLCEQAREDLHRSLEILQNKDLPFATQPDTCIFTDEVTEEDRQKYIENGCKEALKASNVTLLAYRLLTLTHQVQQSHAHQQTPHSITAIYSEKNALSIVLAFCLGTGYKLATHTRPADRFLQLETVHKSFSE